MTKTLDLNIWDRDFSLEIEFDCYSGEIVTKEQKKAIKDFASHPEWIIKAKTVVENYCKEQVMEDEENSKKDSIFSYIKPDYVFVKRDDNPRVAIMCKYRYDLEHGLAIVFTHDGQVIVGLQDIIL